MMPPPGANMLQLLTCHHVICACTLRHVQAARMNECQYAQLRSCACVCKACEEGQVLPAGVLLCG
eukprot:10460042-Heterocapsa_arctica.AAC.1